MIGVSTGGPQALKQMIPRLPPDFPVPVAIVLHMPVGFTGLFASSLGAVSRLSRHRGAGRGDGPAGGGLHRPRRLSFNLQPAPEGTVITRLDLEPSNTPHRPAVDVLFRSAAEVYGDRVLSVVLTGMGADGTEGAAWVKAQGGRVFSEAEETCVVYGMPRSVVEAGLYRRQRPATRHGAGDQRGSVMATILVVDDSNLSRRTSRRILEAGGHRVRDVADGMSALEQYSWTGRTSCCST